MPTPKKPTTETITFLNLTIHPQKTLNQAITLWIQQNQQTLDNITKNITKHIYKQDTTPANYDNTRSHQAETIMLMIHNHRTHPSKMLDCKNIAAYIHRNTNSRTRHANDKLETPASGMTNARRKQREAQHTIHQLANQGIQNPTIPQIIQTTNNRLLANRQNPAKSGSLLTPKDLQTNWNQPTTLEDWNQPTPRHGIDQDTLTQCRIQLLNTLPKLANQWINNLQNPSPHANPLLETADPLFRAITTPLLENYPLPEKHGTTTLNLITLNAHAGTLAYGYARAGLHPTLAIDTNKTNLNITAKSLNIPTITPNHPKYEQTLENYTTSPYILAAQPQTPTDHQNLTRLTSTHQPYLVTVWETPKNTNPHLTNTLKKQGYTTSTIKLYAAKCGVPLNQYWQITIAALNPQTTHTLTTLLEKLEKNPTTSLKDYWPSIPLDGIWTRRSHKQRNTTPITQPHPALPDANRQKPKNYQPHPHDVKGKTRALTTSELRHILTIPATYQLPKHCYQALRHCIPPKTAWTVATLIRASLKKNKYALAA